MTDISGGSSSGNGVNASSARMERHANSATVIRQKNRIASLVTNYPLLAISHQLEIALFDVILFLAES
jgi:hypothetical protein